MDRDVLLLAWAHRIASDEASVVELEADSSLSGADKRTVLFLALYEIEYQAAKRDRVSPRWRRAQALLRSFLTPDQRAQLRSTRGFRVRGSRGNHYRLYPQTGIVWRVELRGKRWRGIASYCLHDYAEDDPDFMPIGLPNDRQSLLPAPDLSVAHLLMLRADEGEFRLKANESLRYGLNPGSRAEWEFRLHEEHRLIEQEREARAEDAA